MQNSYPRLYHRMASRPIWNCDVQAGDIRVMRDFWLQLCMVGAAGLEAADQAAYNILLSLRPWSEICLVYNERRRMGLPGRYHSLASHD
jgi:hypothetical protein